MSKVISVLNLKGGSGKTTVATNLAVAFAMGGAKTLLIDTDKQESSVSWFGNRGEDLVKLNVVALSDAQALKKQIVDFGEIYDVVIIDGAPQVDILAAVSIMASDLILLPVAPSPYDIWATETMVDRIKTAQEVLPAIQAFFLINRDSPRTNLSGECEKVLEKLELPTMETKLGNRIVYADSAVAGETVLENTTNDKAKTEVETLYNEILQKFQ